MRLRLIRLAPEVHVLVMVMHHIISDGWSMSVLFREIAAIYGHIVDDESIDLPKLTIQYPDFARWQRESMKGEVLARQLEYWKNKLDGSPRFLDFQTDFTRPLIQSHRGATRHLPLDPALSRDLQRMSKREGVTLFMTLLAAFQTLLWRYTSAEDLLIGVPIAGRNDVELENLIGLFVNTVVIRGDLAGNPTFCSLLQRVRATTLEAYEHQDTPFEKIVEALEPERSLSHTPLFQVMFILQNMPKQEIELSNLKLEELEFDGGLAKFDLTLEIFELEGLHCRFEYSTDLFESQTIDRMMRHFETLLRSIVRKPDSHLSELEILPPEESTEILLRWNATESTFRVEATIHELFEEAVQRTPERVALVEGSDRVTFRELNERANRVSRYLVSKKLEPKAPVGVLVERSIDMVVALFGILKAGHPYLPIDSSYPAQRIAFMVQDSGASTVITHRGLRALLPDSVDVLRLDADTDLLLQHNSSDLRLPSIADATAYVIYTSGSTGQPKGVEGTHRGAVNRFEWMWRIYPFQAGEIACQKTALGFVDSVWEIFGPLLQSVSLVIVPEAILLDPERLVNLLAEYGVSRIVLVPSFLRVLLDQVPRLNSRLPDLRLWISSGEVLPLDLARRFCDAFSNCTLLNLYGSSEVAADVTWHEVRNLEGCSSVPIGKPIANVQIYILDRYMQPVPIGARGEIHVGGACLARGYWQRPELTAERFVANPFDAKNSPWLYKTGDLGRYFPSGSIEYLGRSDNQIKLRGMRIELNEVEAILRKHPLLREAAVTLSGNTPELQQLIAYVVPTERAAPERSELTQFLKSRVPSYMIPSVFIPLRALPLLPNGKVDRNALPSPDEERLHSEYTILMPRNETEAKLAVMWCEVLGRERIGIDQNFFDLGGHSLLGMQLFARIRRAFEVELPVRRLFEEPTIAGLAVEVEKAKANGGGVRAPITSRRSRASSDSLAAALQELSQDEIASLLQRVLRERQGQPADLN